MTRLGRMIGGWLGLAAAGTDLESEDLAGPAPREGRGRPGRGRASKSRLPWCPTRDRWRVASGCEWIALYLLIYLRFRPVMLRATLYRYSRFISTHRRQNRDR